jgi:hypothetical protein
MSLARTAFDTDLLPLDAIRLDAYCEITGIPLRFLPYRWQPARPHGETMFDHVEKPPQLPIQWAVDVYETEPGGLHDVEDPFIAELYRNMIRDGWTGRDALEQLEYILRRDHNREHRKWLDKKRNVRVWVEAEFQRDYAKAEKRRVREIVRRGQIWIDDQVAKDKSADARDIYIGAPPTMPVMRTRSPAAAMMDEAPEVEPKRTRTPIDEAAARRRLQAVASGVQNGLFRLKDKATRKEIGKALK